MGGDHLCGRNTTVPAPPVAGQGQASRARGEAKVRAGPARLRLTSDGEVRAKETIPGRIAHAGRTRPCRPSCTQETAKATRAGKTTAAARAPSDDTGRGFRAA